MSREREKYEPVLHRRVPVWPVHNRANMDRNSRVTKWKARVIKCKLFFVVVVVVVVVVWGVMVPGVPSVERGNWDENATSCSVVCSL